ncbi:TPA: hypothetical protein ACMEO8_001356 [Klebsiella quasipneumoniae subsp. similipneumoniae]
MTFWIVGFVITAAQGATNIRNFIVIRGPSDHLAPSRSNSAYSEAALLALAFQPVVMLLSLIASSANIRANISTPISLNSGYDAIGGGDIFQRITNIVSAARIILSANLAEVNRMTMVCNGVLQRHILRRQLPYLFTQTISAVMVTVFTAMPGKSAITVKHVPDLFYVHAVHHSINMQIPTVTTAISTQQITSNRAASRRRVYLL